MKDGTSRLGSLENQNFPHLEELWGKSVKVKSNLTFQRLVEYGEGNVVKLEEKMQLSTLLPPQSTKSGGNKPWLVEKISTASEKEGKLQGTSGKR